MRIQGTGGPKGIASTGKSGKASGKARAGKSHAARDRVKVADAAGLREKARVMLADLPEVRLERIEAIRDAIERGAFRTDAQAVARRIVANALAEHPW